MTGTIRHLEENGFNCPTGRSAARETRLLVECRQMTSSEGKPTRERATLIERRARKIVNARSVTIGLATTFLGLSFVGAIVIRIFDHQDFPSLGLAVWWALQTVTTVGYGDVVPKTDVGRVVGGVEMVLGVSFFTFLTAGVTSTVIRRASARALEDDRSHAERSTTAILDALAETREAISRPAVPDYEDRGRTWGCRGETARARPRGDARCGLPHRRRPARLARRRDATADQARDAGRARAATRRPATGDR
jgi:voltage-gated potassium channel